MAMSMIVNKTFIEVEDEPSGPARSPARRNASEPPRGRWSIAAEPPERRRSVVADMNAFFEEEMKGRAGLELSALSSDEETSASPRLRPRWESMDEEPDAWSSGPVSSPPPAKKELSTSESMSAEQVANLITESARLAQENQLLQENARLAKENALLLRMAGQMEARGDVAAPAMCWGSPVYYQVPMQGAYFQGQWAGQQQGAYEGASRRGGGGRRQQTPVWGDAHAPQQPQPVAEDQRTTLMLRNLPNNYTRETVKTLLDMEGFAGKYDFLYLPIDFQTGAALGYAFVNLLHPSLVNGFWQIFDGYSRWVLPSRKVGGVTWSGRHQGLEAHVERYRNSPIMHASVGDECRPAIFWNGARVAFPAPTREPKAPRVRQLAEEVC